MKMESQDYYQDWMKTNTITNILGEWKWETGKRNWERKMKTEEDGVCMREDVHMEEPFQMPIFYNNKKCSRVCSQCSRVQGKLSGVFDRLTRAVQESNECRCPAYVEHVDTPKPTSVCASYCLCTNDPSSH